MGYQAISVVKKSNLIFAFFTILAALLKIKY